MSEQTNGDFRKRVEDALNMIRPQLQADGGDIELVSIEDKTVNVKLTGACHGCPMAAYTLQLGVERVLKQQVPEVEKVQAIQEPEG